MQKREVRPGRPKGATTFDPVVATAFGVVLRARRLASGLSQEAMAHMAQIERSHMGKIERGEHLPSVVMLLRVAQVLGCKPGELVDAAAELAQAPPKRKRTS